MGYYPVGYGFEQLLIEALYFFGMFVIVASIVSVIYGFIYSFLYGVDV
ncbi:MAG: hypothetical protein C0P75_011795 [Bacilli bacterium]|jgi:hypothetical protein|uniref:Uncharacterized protein n=1 Tax=Ureibacillus suwonensis TaxID=313007 RepID=A0ABW0RCG9_9BACL